MFVRELRAQINRVLSGAPGEMYEHPDEYVETRRHLVEAYERARGT